MGLTNVDLGWEIDGIKLKVLEILPKKRTIRSVIGKLVRKTLHKNDWCN